MGMHVPGGDGVDAEVLCKIAECGVAAHVASLEGTLQLDEEAIAAECMGERVNCMRITRRKSEAGAA